MVPVQWVSNLIIFGSSTSPINFDRSSSNRHTSRNLSSCSYSLYTLCRDDDDWWDACCFHDICFTKPRKLPLVIVVPPLFPPAWEKEDRFNDGRRFVFGGGSPSPCTLRCGGCSLCSAGLRLLLQSLISSTCKLVLLLLCREERKLENILFLKLGRLRCGWSCCWCWSCGWSPLLPLPLPLWWVLFSISAISAAYAASTIKAWVVLESELFREWVPRLVSTTLLSLA